MTHQRTIESIQAQEIVLRYTNAKGHATKYTPECLVRFRGDIGRKPMLVEVKTREDLKTQWAELRARFRIATGHARRNGWIFRIYTDAEIRTPYLTTIRGLRLHRTHHFAADEQARIAAHLIARPGLSFRNALSELERWWPDSRAENLSRLYNLICGGQIEADLFKPIGYDTVLGPPGFWPERPWCRRWLRSAAVPLPKARRGW
ncbi:TnsA endonuclease N-terminal domain-containing protein [Panacagrimonas perspica]|nr:TnsA endonuclease N-terminal domain-containing protein [Panacagrimonas perspica]